MQYGSVATASQRVVQPRSLKAATTRQLRDDAWNGTAGGTNVSEFGAAFITSPITGSWDFANPVRNLTFTLDHDSSSGTTYDDEFTLAIYDENNTLGPAATVIAAMTGIIGATVYADANGHVVAEADNTTAEFITVNFRVSGSVRSISRMMWVLTSNCTRYFNHCTNRRDLVLCCFRRFILRLTSRRFRTQANVTQAILASYSLKKHLLVKRILDFSLLMRAI